MKLKIILKRQVAILSCLVFLIGIVSCNSDPCAVVPCDADPKVEIEPPEGSGTPTTRSGEFSFILNDKIDTYFENGVDMELQFRYDNTTGAFVPVGFIQIVRTVNLCDGRFIYPTEEKRERATPEGWYVDRAEGYRSAIYGQMDNGDFELYARMGTERTPASITDSPYRPENHPFLGIRWQAVSVPVDIRTNESDCDNPRFGYYYWSWTVTEYGSLENIKRGIANRSLINDVNNALNKWTSHPSHPDRECIAARVP